MWKRLTLALVVGAVLALALLLWQQHRKAQNAEATAARAEVQRDSAQAKAQRFRQAADSVARVVDSLEAIREREREEAAARAARLEQEADSLSHAIVEAATSSPDPEEVEEAVTEAVTELRQTYERRITDLERLLVLSDESIDQLRREAQMREQANAGLREALGLAERERDAWRSAARPGLLDRISDSAGLLSGAVAGGVLLGVLAGR